MRVIFTENFSGLEVGGSGCCILGGGPSVWNSSLDLTSDVNCPALGPWQPQLAEPEEPVLLREGSKVAPRNAISRQIVNVGPP